jgi:putative ABC transport system permease protein
MPQDLRYALRQMWKAPGFTAVAVLTLALGIGANTAIFTLLDQALLRTLPVSHPEQLVRLRYEGSNTGRINVFGGDDKDFFSYPMYRDLRDRNTVFDGMLTNDEAQVGVQWNKQPELVSAELVSGNYFDVLGIRPAFGRLFVPADDRSPSGSAVVVLSFNYWKTRFGSDPRILGQALLINAQPFTIVGVAQPDFHSVIAGFTPKVFLPVTTVGMVIPGLNDLENRRSAWLNIVARLKPGVGRGQAEAGINPLWRSLRADELKDITVTSEKFRRLFVEKSNLTLLDESRGFSPLRDQIQTPLLIVMAMVGLVVLMACVNVSSLLLVRAAARTREMSVRYAMGASRWQITRQLLMEGILLGFLGGALGLLFAPAVSALLIRQVAGASATELPFSSHPDARILWFNFGLALVVSLVFSLAPALRFLHPDLANSLKQQTTTGGAGPMRFRRVSVALQIGLSLLLLIGAGLFVQTLHQLRAVDVGFTTDHLLTFGIDPMLAGYGKDQVITLHQRILRSLTGLPGVRAAGGTDDPEIAGNDMQSNYTIAGYTPPPDEDVVVEIPSVTPEYFSTMGSTLLAGRDFSPQDVAGKQKVAIVNAKFARRYFGEPRNAVGHFIGRGGGSKAKIDTEIIAVVRDSKHSGIRDAVRETVYTPYYQNEQPNYMQFYVRTWQAPETAEAAVRAALQQTDSKLVIDTLRTMDEQIADNISSERLVTMLAVSFGLLATLLAAIGLYGVLAYATEQRTREIGIRMALGAQRLTVVRLVLADVLWLAGVSIVVTLPVAILLSRALRSQLYNVSPTDPLVLAGGTLLVAFVAVIAALLPARRAASVEPMKALRTE